jgi:hypothetical protein
MFHSIYIVNKLIDSTISSFMDQKISIVFWRTVQAQKSLPKASKTLASPPETPPADKGQAKS